MGDKFTTKISKIAVFIDASNLWSSYKSMGKMLELNKLNSFFSEKFDAEIFRIFYYVAYPKEGTREKEKINRLHNFFVYLEKNLKFTVIKKPLKKTILLRDKNGKIIFNDKTKEPLKVEKGNLDVEITMDVLKYSTAFQIAIFLTGDSDFLPIVIHLRNLKSPKIVYIFSTKDCVSEELKTGGNGYFDLADFPEIQKCKLLSENDRKKQLTQNVQAVSMEY